MQTHRTWRISRRASIVLDRPRLMGILNVTPDSFSDDGRFAGPPEALAAAQRMTTEGADVIDVGGESTRPGARPVSAEEQIARVVPVVAALRAASAIPITIDTTLAPVARAALDAGADAVNDVSAGTDDPGMLTLIAERGAGVVLMHRLTPPSRDQFSDRYTRPPEYVDVVAEVAAFLQARAAAALSAGIPREAIVLDPGLGFGKTVEQNLRLIDQTQALAALGYPILSGLSRKSFVGRAMLGRDSKPDERLAGTLAMSVRHARAGAAIFRVHDVAAHVGVLRGGGRAGCGEGPLS